ncbi:MAG: hypothetical protein ABIT68_01410 [Sphingomicrobium sp.]
MRAGLRFGIAASAAALALAPAPLLAQDAAPVTNTPATDTIGPRELQNFTLNGTVTRPAPTTPVRTVPVPAPAATQPRDQAPVPPRPRPAPTSSVTTTLPPASPLPQTITPAPTTGLVPSATVEPTPIAPEQTSASPTNGYIPWLLALILLGAGAGFLLWRRRSPPRYATAAGVSELVALPQMAPPPPLQRAPVPSAPPPAAPRTASGPSGIVSSRMRPWLEIGFSPGRCVVEEQGATIQFDVEVYNSGSAPARDVLVEASMFNAGPEQDAEIGAFFAHPVAQGERIPAIPPLARIALHSAVSLTLEQMRQYEVGGRRLFVPLIGFNALYRWSGGDGQTSTSYLVGRDTKSEKMAPLRLDLGPRTFRGLGARQHNVGVRK